MKKKILIAIAVLSFFSCTEKEPEIQVLPVEMLSFGFYQEDNSDVLRADVIAKFTSSSSIDATFPYGVTKDDIKKLVPRFTVTDGATVTVNDAVAVSGKTELDFTYPVDFVVSLNEKSNAYYSVRCSIENVKEFSYAGISETPGFYDHIMAISPKDNVPYFITNDSTKTTADRYPHLYKYNGTNIESVTTLTQARAECLTMRFSPAGSLYVAFLDYGAENKATSLMKVEGSNASYVGEAGSIYKTPTTQYAMGVLPMSDNDIYVGHQVAAATGSLAKRALNIAHYNGGLWQNEIAAPGRKASNYGYSTICKYKNGIGYMLVYNQNGNSVDLYKFIPEIESIANDLKIIKSNSNDELLESINLRAINFDVASNGDIYMLVCGQYIDQTYCPAIIRYEQATGKQTIIGGAIPEIDIDDLGSRSAIVALDCYNMPYIAIRNGGKAFLYYMDPESYEWKSVQISDMDAERPQIEFASDGTGYFAFQNSDSKKVVLYKTK
ncbi:MAG: hypothetical protein NC308_06440 [Clostridium sp.]|nr:hypothetical protein [Bacteroides sp.]MCM1198510.1 hypothetical protein [Clostridium sp.]